MQSFPEYYLKGIPLGTQSQWGWHSFPNPEKFTLNDVYKNFKSGDRSVPYVYQYSGNKDERKNKASQWLRENPHRFDLGLIGLEIIKKDSGTFDIADIKNPVQMLNLWTGQIYSKFEVEGSTVEVTTYCHQQKDLIAVRIVSDLLLSEKIKIKVRFLYPSHKKFGPAYDLNYRDKQYIRMADVSDSGVILKRQLDETTCFTQFSWKGKAIIQESGNYTYIVCPEKSSRVFELSALFSKESKNDKLPSFTKTAENNKESWKKFWNSGGAIDFSACTDPRAFELERRVVLSQYLTKIQCSGSLPPQETGLTYNSWFGKFHLEMHWWHSMHFILWQRAELMESQIKYYFDILDKAEKTAKLQGYKGARWPKMVGPDGRESPSTIGPFLIWQQPHLIYFAELLYRYHHQDSSVLGKYKKLVFATADFMASYTRMDITRNMYVLGPSLIPAQERFAAETTINPAFELAYWYWGLQVAQKWKERLGMKQDAHWQDVIDKLAPLPVKDSLYLFCESAENSYSDSVYLTDHPMVLGVLGFLPETQKINRKIMEKTLAEVIKLWQWNTIWGWDMPMVAMNAAYLNKSELALDMLLMNTPKNTFLMNGHNYQDKDLTLYLPGNGALLTAVAMMCTYRNEKGGNGFPSDGKWNVQYENLLSLY
jgi:protein-glucosylgalactosylhydroxylysine glucosidase